MGLLLSGAQDHHGQKVSSVNRDGLCPLLSDDQIRRLDAATAIALDNPHNLNRTKRNQKMNGCCRITPEWSASLTSSGLWKGCPLLGTDSLHTMIRDPFCEVAPHADTFDQQGLQKSVR
jgi:hypothetical protein